MSEDWNAVAAEVAAGLVEAGTTATIIRAGVTTGPTHNPTHGQPKKYPVTVVYDSWRADQIDGTLIKVGDRKVLVASSGLAITPQPNDIFRDASGKEFSVVPPAASTSPAGVAVMHTINIRG